MTAETIKDTHIMGVKRYKPNPVQDTWTGMNEEISESRSKRGVDLKNFIRSANEAQIERLEKVLYSVSKEDETKKDETRNFEINEAISDDGTPKFGIPASNVGHQILKKLGWKGNSLKPGSLLYPVRTHFRRTRDHRGLGAYVQELKFTHTFKKKFARSNRFRIDKRIEQSNINVVNSTTDFTTPLFEFFREIGVFQSTDDFNQFLECIKTPPLDVFRMTSLNNPANRLVKVKLDQMIDNQTNINNILQIDSLLQQNQPEQKHKDNPNNSHPHYCLYQLTVPISELRKEIQFFLSSELIQGHIWKQRIDSMIPALFMMPIKPCYKILDICATPDSTNQILELLSSAQPQNTSKTEVESTLNHLKSMSDLAHWDYFYFASNSNDKSIANI